MIKSPCRHSVLDLSLPRTRYGGIQCFQAVIDSDFRRNDVRGRFSKVSNYRRIHKQPFKRGECGALKGCIKINKELCKECHLCVSVCKNGQIVASKEYNTMGYRPVVFKETGECTGCALCAIICPEVAIEVYRE